MKIRLAILERDASYLERLRAVFSTRYSDKFELYSFTSQEAVMTTLDEAKIDVLLVDDSFEIDPGRLPHRCALAYLVESADIESVRDQIAIFKYQKAEMIYKQILSIYADQASSVSGLKMDDNSCKLAVFLSASGGTGSSSLAAATAVRYAAQGKRVLYLNLEKVGDSGAFFSGAGQFDMSDVVFALKSKKTNLVLKLESFVRQDESGVKFFAPPKLALDMMELGTADIQQLLTELKLTGSYDYILIDTDFSLDQESMKIYRNAHSILLVGDGTEISNRKTARAWESLMILEQNADSPLTNRVKIIYNKFSNKTGRIMEDTGMKYLGGAPRYEHAGTAEIIRRLSAIEMLDQIV